MFFSEIILFFFYDPRDVGSLISGSSAFSKFSFNIWKFMFHILLKPTLENFEHYFASVGNECNCAVVWTFFDIAYFALKKIWGFAEGVSASLLLEGGSQSILQRTQPRSCPVYGRWGVSHGQPHTSWPQTGHSRLPNLGNVEKTRRQKCQK